MQRAPDPSEHVWPLYDMQYHGAEVVVVLLVVVVVVVVELVVVVGEAVVVVLRHGVKKVDEETPQGDMPSSLHGLRHSQPASQSS